MILVIVQHLFSKRECNTQTKRDYQSLYMFPIYIYRELSLNRNMRIEAGYGGSFL
jgi:hypothetical protein